ncbi:glutathione S-transferase family protein [Simiduia curdlanivorans]|uniref:Glutathione S-transferase family protein n=1 Tax=Simiduia curdlanivorans TaxID=1492769 RepID=A0ABV8V4Z7_9GAMM|nr:glutathione S-transferase family protein [Simiduia curdlanivorans]MDN3640953.1 glutathione S-transferase family protein [Simiduia curdlanivorans]
MPKIKVTYFDVDGGRGEPIRLALHCAGLPFEDHRFTFPEFAEVRKSTPFGQVPTVDIDGQTLTQSTALCRYFGKQAGLYPADDYQALLCDEVMDVIEDMTHKLVATFGLTGDALKTTREALVNGPLTTYIQWLEARLVKQGKKYFAGNQLSVADLKVFVTTRWLCSGQLDHIPTDLVQELAPTILAHAQQIVNEPKIKAYYDQRASA